MDNSTARIKYRDGRVVELACFNIGRTKYIEASDVARLMFEGSAPDLNRTALVRVLSAIGDGLLSGKALLAMINEGVFDIQKDPEAK